MSRYCLIMVHVSSVANKTYLPYNYNVVYERPILSPDTNFETMRTTVATCLQVP